MSLMTKTQLDAIYAKLADEDARSAFVTVCYLGGAVSVDHFRFQCNAGKSAALDRGSERWATAYARLANAL